MSPTSRQIWIVVVALVLWALWGEPALWALVASYLGAWVLFNWGGWRSIEPPEVRRPVAAMIVVLLLAGPLFRLVERGRAMLVREGLLGVDEEMSDRLRLERYPALAPPVVVADQPQTFFVLAPDATRASLRFGGTHMGGVDLGHGLFRFAYDPRREGPPTEGSALIETDRGQVRRAITVVTHPAHPRWLSASSTRGIAVTVSEETDELVIVDRAGGLKRVPVDDGPTDAVLVDDRVLVSHRYAATLAVVDATKGAIVERRELQPFAVRLAEHDGMVAASIAGEARGVEVLSSDGRDFVPLEETPDWLTFVDGERLVVALLESRSLLRLRREGAGWKRDGQLFLGRPVVTAARHPSEPLWYLATTGYRSDGGMPEGNHFVQDQILTVDLAAWEVIDQTLTGRGDARQEDPGTVTSGGSPMGMAVGQGVLWVTMAGTDEVWRLPIGDAMAGPPEVMLDARRSELPLVAPHGVADLGEGHWAVSSPSTGAVAVFDGREPIAIHRLAPPDAELDATALLRRRGERAFYESTTTGLSCQSCHLHAGEDKSAHDITSKGKDKVMLKATLSTRGVAGTAPYLRNGSFPRIADLADVGRFPYRRRIADRGAVLDAYVKGLALPLHPRALGQRDHDRERRGHDAFVEARCNLCHTPPAFTNLSRHPIRALFPRFGVKVGAGHVLDTPSLLGLWQSAPYLVDGRAATLRSIFAEHNPDNRHGDSQALTETELDDLVYFLEGL